MALVTEDGTAKADAESYASLADADAYFTGRGNATWAALSTEAKEQALRKATDYMGQVYRMRWAGYRKTDTQALDWPRYAVPKPDFYAYYAYYGEDDVPAEVVRACCELAVRASASDLAPDVGRRKLREKVDVIEVEYDPSAAAYTTYRAIDALLAPLLTAGGSARVVRA
jgi:hypothetical protein